MTKDEALRLALEALEDLGNHDRICPQWPTYAEPENYPKCNCGYDQAITAIKAALEAKDEPVAWKLVPIEPTNEMLKAMDECSTEGYDERLPAGIASSVYMAAVEVAPKPPQQKINNEPKCVAIVEVFGKDWRLDYMALPVGKHKLYAQQYLYTTLPPQRTWVGLTDEEIVLIVAECAASHQHTDIHFARAIEAKLRSKNT